MTGKARGESRAPQLDATRCAAETPERADGAILELGSDEKSPTAMRSMAAGGKTAQPSKIKAIGSARKTARVTDAEAKTS